MFTNRALAPPKKTLKDQFHTFKLSEQLIDTYSVRSLSNEGLCRVLELCKKKKKVGRSKFDCAENTQGHKMPIQFLLQHERGNQADF